MYLHEIYLSPSAEDLLRKSLEDTFLKSLESSLETGLEIDRVNVAMKTNDL